VETKGMDLKLMRSDPSYPVTAAPLKWIAEVAIGDTWAHLNAAVLCT
jgi:hypothetical protein